MEVAIVNHEGLTAVARDSPLTRTSANVCISSDTTYFQENKMHNYKKIVIPLLILMTSIITSRCILPTRETDDYSAEISNPRNGAVFMVGDRVPLGVGISDFQAGEFERTNRLVVTANGTTVGTLTLSWIGGPVGHGGSLEWIPEARGEYFLQVVSTRPGKWSISDPVRVCVLGFSLESSAMLRENEWNYGTHGYDGDCDIPERSPHARPGRLSFSAIAVPNRISYYFPPYLTADGNTAYSVHPDECGSDTITFLATAGDPNDDIAFVKVDLSFDHHRYIASSSLILTRQGGSSLDTKVFGGTYPLLERNEIYPESLGESFEVSWTAYAFSRSGGTLAQDGPNTIPVEPCILDDMIPLQGAIPTEPPILEPSYENCPPGTYYAPVTNRCIAIQLPQGGGEGGSAGAGTCSLSVSACSSQGLSFDSNTCQCVPIQ